MDGQVGVADMERLNGFWLLRPDGRRSWFGEYLAAKLREAKASGDFGGASCRGFRGVWVWRTRKYIYIYICGWLPSVFGALKLVSWF